MQYTESRDGIQRATINIKIRLTEKEVEKAKYIAKKYHRTVQEWLSDSSSLHIENELTEYDDC